MSPHYNMVNYGYGSSLPLHNNLLIHLQQLVTIPTLPDGFASTLFSGISSFITLIIQSHFTSAEPAFKYSSRTHTMQPSLLSQAHIALRIHPGTLEGDNLCCFVVG